METLKFQDLSVDDFYCEAFIPADMGLAEIHGKTQNFEIVIDLTNFDVILKEKKREVERKVNLRDWYEKKYLETLPMEAEVFDFDIGLKPAGEVFEILKDFFTDLYIAYGCNKEIEELGYNTLLNFINYCKNYDKEMEKNLTF